MEQTFSVEDKYIWKMQDINKYSMESASYDRYIKPKMLFNFDNENTMYTIDESDWRNIYSWQIPPISMKGFASYAYFDKETQLYSECAEEVNSYLEDFRAESGGDTRR